MSAPQLILSSALMCLCGIFSIFSLAIPSWTVSRSATYGLLRWCDTSSCYNWIQTLHSRSDDTNASGGCDGVYTLWYHTNNGVIASVCLCIASCTLGTLLSLRAADRAGKGLPLGRALLLSRACVSLSAVLCLLSFLLYWGVFAHTYSCPSGGSLRLGGQGGSVQLGYGFFLSLVSFGVSVTGAMVLWVVRPSAIMKQLQ